ncbi:hypothetical protein JOC77_004216 [Peribacillus deserti]|uniref:UDP-glucose 6-dehydrogenase n=1 Tax=Peribacillus deserti TaxID=673318 RepID=A0ABS2QPT1_9BACI|nr:GerMN domain-containing protein [Peribacillus deserti]MBM7694739.1 hypothetical protein [Peribacillus deserti]
MKKYKMSELEIQEALKQFPKITDSRGKEEIFRKVSRTSIKRKGKNRWMPAAASLAAIILFSILTSSFIFSDQSANEKGSSRQEQASDVRQSDTSGGSGKKAAEDPDTQVPNKNLGNTDEKEDEAEEEKPVEEDKTDDHSETVPDKKENIVLKAATLSSSLVLPADSEEHSYITLAVPDSQLQYIIPITYETEKADKQELLDVLLDKMKTINEEELGLMDYYPLNLGISMGKEEGSINIDFTDKSELNNLYEFGLLMALENTFRYQGYNKITFSTAGKPGIELPDTGPITERVLEQTPKRAFLIYQAEESKPKFLVPNITASSNTVAEAIKEMQNFEPVNSASPSIPADIKIEKVTNENGRLTISLSKDTPFKDDESSLLAIEAILLTAKDFGLTAVLFENAGLSAIGPYDLTKELEIPLAPNRIQ